MEITEILEFNLFGKHLWYSEAAKFATRCEFIVAKVKAKEETSAWLTFSMRSKRQKMVISSHHLILIKFSWKILNSFPPRASTKQRQIYAEPTDDDPSLVQ
jgi:hypothetical protein